LSRFIGLGIDFAVDGAKENIYRIVASFATMSQIVDLIVSVTAAATTALLLALIARDNIGMPPDMVREDALIAASVIIAGVAGMSSPRRRRW
jgi:hypothetical protein